LRRAGIDALARPPSLSILNRFSNESSAVSTSGSPRDAELDADQLSAIVEVCAWTHAGRRAQASHRYLQ
jgi:hypothetical protein